LCGDGGGGAEGSGEVVVVVARHGGCKRERGCPWSDKQGRGGKVVYFNCLLAVKSSGKL